MSLRKFARLAGTLAALFPFATCSDFTGPSGRGVRVAVAPTFSPAATFAKAVYSSAGVEFDRVRVLVVRGETEVLKDTTVAFSPASPDLTLPLLISAAPGEVVTVTLEYRTADLILYSGTSSVTAIAVGASSPTPTPIVLVPVGPGATAESVSISPTSGSFPVSDPVSFSAQALTGAGAPIANAIFAWSVDDATVASVNGQGVVQPTSKGGTVHVRATTLNGKFGEATVTFVTAPTAVAIVSGNNQTAMSFEALPSPVVVKVVDQNNNGVAGVTVNFAVATGGGTVAPTSGVTDASGLVSTTWTLGEVIGEQKVTATAAPLPNAPATVSATGTERPAVQLAFLQQPTKSVMGASIAPPVTVKALDDKGRLVSGFTGAVTMAFDVNPSSATLGGTLTVNAAGGVATFSNLAVSAAGKGYTLKAASGTLAIAKSSAFDVDQVPSGLSLVSGGSQTAVIRTTLAQIAVKVADANGIGVPGITVAFEVVTGAGSLVVNNGTTDASGLAKVTWTLGDSIGTQSIRATSTGLSGSPLTITATATPLPAVGLAFVQGPSNVVVNATMSPAVTVKAIDADGKTVTGFTGTIALILENNSSATLGGATSATAVNGVATFANLSVNLSGSGYALKATSGTLATATSGTFVVSPPPATALKFKVQPSNVASGSSITPAVEVEIVDANGNRVPGATNTVQITFGNAPVGTTLSGTRTKAAVNGVVVFDDLKISLPGTGYTLRAIATGGLTEATSASFDVTAPPARNWNGSVSTNWHEAANWTPSGVPTADDSVNISTATSQPTISAAAAARFIVIETAGTLKINAAELFINVPKVVNKGTLQLTWASLGGDIDNRGTLEVDGVALAINLSNAPGGTVRVVSRNGGAQLSIAHVFTNRAFTHLTDEDGGQAALSAGDSLVNNAGAFVTAMAGLGGDRIILATLRNYGTLSIASPSGLYLYHSATGSINTGTLEWAVNAPLQQTFTDTTFTFENTGTIAVGSASWFFGGGKFRMRGAGSVTGTGAFKAFASQLDFDLNRLAPTITVDETSRFAGTSLTVPTGVTTSFTASVLAQPVNVGGTLKVKETDAGETYFKAGLNILAGGVAEIASDSRVDATLSNANGGKLTLIATGSDRMMEVANDFSNAGVIDMTSAGIFRSIISMEAMLTNEATGTINALGGFGGERGVRGKLENRGTINVEAGSFFTLLSGSTANTNYGSINLQSVATAPEVQTAEHLTSFGVLSDGSPTTFTNNGTISVGAYRSIYVGGGATMNNAGVIAGIGKMRVPLEATFSNSGTFAPGGPSKVGTFTFEGNLVLGAGSVEIDVESMSSADFLKVTGNVDVEGTKVAVNELAGFTSEGGSLKVIEGGSQGFSCSGRPVITPDATWSGFNDGCVFIFPKPRVAPKPSP